MRYNKSIECASLSLSLSLKTNTLKRLDCPTSWTLVFSRERCGVVFPWRGPLNCCSCLFRASLSRAGDGGRRLLAPRDGGLRS